MFDIRFRTVTEGIWKILMLDWKTGFFSIQKSRNSSLLEFVRFINFVAITIITFEMSAVSRTWGTLDPRHLWGTNQKWMRSHRKKLRAFIVCFQEPIIYNVWHCNTLLNSIISGQ